MIYLDYSANTPADPRVAEAFLRASLDFPGNPNSKHPAGQAAANALSESRSHIAKLLSVLPEELIFTSGATESNNLALLGSVAARRHVGRHIISTALEHPSVSACLSHLQENGYEIDLLPILSNGRIDLEALSSLLRKDTCLVALSAVDSEAACRGRRTDTPFPRLPLSCRCNPGDWKNKHRLSPCRQRELCAAQVLRPYRQRCFI